MPIQPFASTHNQFRKHPSTAIRHALTGVYDKLLNPSKLPCLLSRIVSVALSCLILLADLSALVKIGNRFPDEWND